MAHDLDGIGAPDVFTQTALDMVRSKVVLLNRVRTDILPENEIPSGGNSFLVYPPTTSQTPADFDENADHETAVATHEITRTPITATFNRHKNIRVDWTLFESRLARGNFDTAFSWAFGGFIDGFSRAIESDLAAQYAYAGDSVGTGATAMSDALVRDFLKKLAQQEIDPSVEDVSLVVGSDVHWGELLEDDRYARADVAGNAAAMPSLGKLSNFYGLTWGHTPRIVGSFGSGGTVIHNMGFHRDAIGITFKHFEPVSKYVSAVGQNVEESVLRDPVSNVVIRFQKYYDPRKKKMIAEFDVAWGAYVLIATRLIDVRTMSAEA